MTDKIIITKYSSRRLYNTQTSEYVTLDQIAEFIRDGKEIQIIDKETNCLLYTSPSPRDR